jgi:hypothetical protein
MMQYISKGEQVRDLILITVVDMENNKENLAVL